MIRKMGSDNTNYLLAAAVIFAMAKHLYPPTNDTHDRKEGHSSVPASVLNHPPVMNEQRVSVAFYNAAYSVLDYVFAIKPLFLYADVQKASRRRKPSGEAGVKSFDRFSARALAGMDLGRLHRNAIVLAKYLNKRSYCSALAASRRRRKRCKNF